MGDAGELLKKYWPWAVGGVVGLLLISRYMGGGSQASGDSSLAAFYQAQASASAQQQANAAAQMQAQTNRDVAMASIDLQREQVRASSESQYLAAQANMALAVGQSASGTIAALYAPSIAALNAAGYENAAALQAGATVAAAGLTAQGAATAAVGEALKGYGAVANAVSSMPASNQGGSNSWVDLATLGVSAYTGVPLYAM